MSQDRTAVAGPDEMSGRDIGDAAEPVEERPAVDDTVIEQLATITDGQGFSVLGELLNAFLSAMPETTPPPCVWSARCTPSSCGSAPGW
jgi:hypothetical protein